MVFIIVWQSKMTEKLGTRHARVVRLAIGENIHVELALADITCKVVDTLQQKPHTQKFFLKPLAFYFIYFNK